MYSENISPCNTKKLHEPVFHNLNLDQQIIFYTCNCTDSNRYNCIFFYLPDSFSKLVYFLIIFNKK